MGCVGISVRGTVHESMLHDTRFNPVWAAALDLDLAIGIHVGWSHPGLTASAHHYYACATLSLMFPVVMGFFSFFGGGILDRFPRLRVAFLEAGVEWLPMIVSRMEHYYKSSTRIGMPLRTKKPVTERMQEAEFYISTEGDDPMLTHVIDLIGERRVMISGDMPHGDVPVDLLPSFRARADIGAPSRQRIIGENAARFYRLH